jgi:hypothetical protein
MALNGAHQFVVYADDVYVLGASIHAIKQNRSLVVSSKLIDIKVNADKTQYMVNQNAGRETVSRLITVLLKWFQFFGKPVTIQNSIGKKLQHTAVRECLLSFGEDSFVFLFAIQNYEE